MNKDLQYPDLKSLDEASESHDLKMAEVPNSPRFGYSQLDEKIPGLLPGQLTVFAGGTSMGKTTFLANCAYNMAFVQDKKVLFASLESGDSVVVPIRHLSGGKSSGNLHIFSPKTQVDIKTLGKMVQSRIELCEVLIIDHIHYLSSSNTSNYSAHIGELVRQIQLMAVTLHIPIILVAHVRKMSHEGQIPSLHDLKDSSALYQDPSTVMIIHRFKEDTDKMLQDKNIQKFSEKGTIIIEKNRDFGHTGALPLRFDQKTLRFSVGEKWVNIDKQS